MDFIPISVLASVLPKTALNGSYCCKIPHRNEINLIKNNKLATTNRLVWDQRVGSSNLSTPTIFSRKCNIDSHRHDRRVTLRRPLVPFCDGFWRESQEFLELSAGDRGSSPPVQDRLPSRAVRGLPTFPSRLFPRDGFWCGCEPPASRPSTTRSSAASSRCRKHRWCVAMRAPASSKAATPTLPTARGWHFSAPSASSKWDLQRACRGAEGIAAAYSRHGR